MNVGYLLMNILTMVNSMTNDLEKIWQRLLATSGRKKKAFGYHMEGNDPVWNGEDVADEYTTETYHAENLP